MPTIEELAMRASRDGTQVPPGLRPAPGAIPAPPSGKQTITFGDPDEQMPASPIGGGVPITPPPVSPRPAPSALTAAGAPRVTAAGAGMVRQNIATPPRITPNDGTRVDNGATVSLANPNVPTSPMPTTSGGMRPLGGGPMGGAPGSIIPPAPPVNEEPPAPAPTDNGGGRKPNNNGEKKKGGKNLWILIGAGVTIFLIIVLAIVAKNNEGSAGNAPTPTPETTVQDFQEYDDPFGLGNGDEWIIDTFKYTELELASLRRVGYTSTEIEDAQLLETPAQELIDAAEAERQKYLEETIKPYYEARSEEFKELESQTWLGLPELDEDTIPSTPEEYDSLRTTSKTVNTDYEKVDPRGKQLWLKIYTDKTKTDWVYYQCNYREWNSLDNEGNVVVNFQITTLETADKYYEDWRVVSITVY